MNPFEAAMSLSQEPSYGVVKSEKPFQFHPDFVDWKGVSYEEETINGKRHYTIDGERYPSITTVLSADKQKQKVLANWRKYVGEAEANRIQKYSQKRGTALHKLCESYVIKNETQLKTYQEKENFLKIKPHLDRGIGRLFCLETPLFSKSLGVAGRTDLIAEWLGDDGHICPTVIDFKTSGKTKYRKNISQYFIQGAAYASMFYEMTGIEVPRIAIIIVTEELPEPQVFVESTNTWMQPLKAALAAYKESINHDNQVEGLDI